MEEIKKYEIITNSSGRDMLQFLGEYIDGINIIKCELEKKDGQYTGNYNIDIELKEYEIISKTLGNLRHAGRKPKKDTSAEMIISDIEYGVPLGLICKTYGISERTVYRRLEEYKTEHPNENIPKIKREKPEKKKTAAAASNKQVRATANKNKAKKKKKKRNK